MVYADVKSQNELERLLFGENASKSRGRISRYVTGARGTSSLDPALFEKIADALGVDYHWLMTGRGRMTPPLTGPDHTEPLRNR